MSDQEALPGLADDTPPADEFIRKLLIDALIADRSENLPELSASRACATNAEVAALYAPWNAATYAFLMHAVTAHLLIRIHETSPNLAAGLAREVEDYLDAGDAYPEWVWEWATARGINTEETIETARAKHAAWLAAPRTPPAG